MAKKRCTYILDSGKQCAKAGVGQPPLCAEHEVTEEPDMLKTILNHPGMQGIFSRAQVALDHLAQYIDRGFSPLGSPDGAAPKPKRESNAIQKEQQAREILGFSLAIQLTTKQVQERRRALAALAHPDKGGSEKAMTKINLAADYLISILK